MVGAERVSGDALVAPVAVNIRIIAGASQVLIVWQSVSPSLPGRWPSDIASG